MTASPDHDLPAEPHAPERPPRLRDRLREQTQVAILDAAERTIIEEGTAHARIDAIAAAAGVSVGTLYNHFADREALVAAVIQDRRRALLGAVSELVDASDLTFAVKLRRFFEIFGHAGVSHGQFVAVVLGEQGGLRSWHCQRDETIAAWFALSKQLLEQGAREGAIRGDRLDAHTTFLFTLAKTAVIGPLAQLPAIGAADLAHFFLHGAASSQHDVPAPDGSSR